MVIRPDRKRPQHRIFIGQLRLFTNVTRVFKASQLEIGERSDETEVICEDVDAFIAGLCETVERRYQRMSCRDVLLMR